MNNNKTNNNKNSK